MSNNELVISYLFPPSKDVSGMVLAKRYIAEDKRFDVIRANVKKDIDLEFEKLVGEYVNEEIIIDMDCNPNLPACIFDFVEKSLEALDNRKPYERITTRAWKLANNFVAMEYKLRQPDVYWTAEFSDPIMYDIYNKSRVDEKKKDITDSKYLDRINNAIIKLNESQDTDFELLKNPCNANFLVEYLAYLFADEIIFTNENQRSVMLDQFPIDVKDFVMDKSTIKPHPILPEKYYNIKDYEVSFDGSKINLGYFGNIYSKRHFEAVFNAYEMLKHKYRNNLQFHFYINDPESFKRLSENLEISENISVNETIDYLDFLNLTTKLDILIINDLITSDCFEVNPYRPSKLSDYIGSKTAIWAICEKGSCLDDFNADYKSYVDSSKSNADVLAEILKDFSFEDESYTIDDPEQYLLKRITDLNIIIDDDRKRYASARLKVKKLKKQNRKLKKDMEKEDSMPKNENKIRKIFGL